ncbi:MAG TPA: response regulator [Ktedonobacterales bacterium]
MAWVLVVDDDEPTRETLRVMLEDAGYAVAEAPDGQAALEMLRSTPYHAIVLFDLLMPVLDGIGFLREVKDDERLAKRHGYILLTANRQALRSDSEELIRSVSVKVVQKPFEVGPLLRLIADVEQALP